jgi:hypothetical protein
MALSDLAVFSEYMYAGLTEVVDQQVEKFNAASRGTITLSPGSHQGDYSEMAFFKKLSGLVRRRNAYGTGTVSGIDMEHLLDTMVKVAAGTPPVNIPPSQFKWIQQNPETAGAAMGQQLAGDTMADMLNTAVIAGRVAIGQNALATLDITAETPDTMSASAMVRGSALFGDRSSDIAAWIMHSGPVHDFYGSAVTNTAQLFTYGSINVISDPFGRIFVVTDSPGLITSGTPNVYWSLGLVNGAINVNQNNDFTDNWETSNGDENIQRTYQAEWSFQVGVKGFSWDKSGGGASPNDAALATATNWDQYATSLKDTAGVLIKSN